MSKKPTDKPLKIAIVGTAPSSAGLAPYDDESWTIWGLSTSPDKMPRWNEWFELHDLKRKRAVHPKYYDTLAAERERPIWLHVADPKIPMGRPFPRAEIIERFAPWFTNSPDNFAYITNTISWLMALAALRIEQNNMHGEVGVWGVDMAVGGVVNRLKSEYSYQRPSCEWFLVYLTAFLKKPVYLPDESDLCSARDMYGFDTDTNPMYTQVRARRIELRQRKNECAENLKQTQETAMRLEGGLIELDYMEQALNGQATDVIKKRRQDLSHHAQQAMASAEELKAGLAGLEGSLVNLDWVEQGCPPGNPAC